jgi:hypothetical protein
MSAAVPLTDSSHGYLSEASKRRFTLVAGILGAVFFLAQFLLPMLVMFAIMIPMMIGEAVSTADLDQAALWRGELWFVERTVNSTGAIRGLEDGVRPQTCAPVDLSPVGPALPWRPSG